MPISIHALLAESDNCFKCSFGNPCKFLSTLSLRRATVFHCFIIIDVKISIHALLAESDVNDAINGCNPDFISIHALLAESDPLWAFCQGHIKNFYPRSPCGERPQPGKPNKLAGLFLSTLSLRRATSPLTHSFSHAINFYPRSPCGERLRFGCGDILIMSISIHALLAESDYTCCACYSPALPISIHALLAESDS